ncbi:MBL fold metallo-hydrolase [Lactococcus carnosus]|uniref:MBL fold metallo-hydrolase n=1 Tax=Pseudolactococcus carnosus TaxID=2749961 RepID=UPI002479C578|nr:MBL fold metallo-hydrolase [Lactococcus carnosus]
MKYTTYKSLYQLTAFSPLFPINAYIFEEQASLTVIDVGLNVFVKHIEKLARKLDKPVKFIILTHPHLDHIAGLDLLKKQFPEAKIVFQNVIPDY